MSIGFIRDDVNPADGLTKFNGNGGLKRIRETGVDGTPVEQWISREAEKSQSTGYGVLGGSVNGAIGMGTEGKSGTAGKG